MQMQLSKADIKHNNSKAEIGDRIAVEQKFKGDIIIDIIYTLRKLCVNMNLHLSNHISLYTYLNKYSFFKSHDNLKKISLLAVLK